MTSIRIPLFLTALGLVVGCSSSSPSPTGSPPSGADSSPTTADSSEVVKLSAIDFEREFKTDGQKAAGKYDGKLIELAGTIQSVSFDPVTSILFEPREGFGGAMCTLKEQVSLGSLTKGQTIVVRGTGATRFAIPRLENAVIVSKGPDTAIRMTAEEMTRAAGEDFRKLYDLCSKKTVILTGEVAAVKQDPMLPVRKNVELKGDGKLTVLCLFGLTDQEKQYVDSCKPGDTVTLIGEMNFVDMEKGYVNFAGCQPMTWKK